MPMGSCLLAAHKTYSPSVRLVVRRQKTNKADLRNARLWRNARRGSPVWCMTGLAHTSDSSPGGRSLAPVTNAPGSKQARFPINNSKSIAWPVVCSMWLLENAYGF
jgi:hypothetical protein